MLLNNIEYTDRHNRPSVLSRVGLKTYFINDGQYFDPYQISAVSIFAAVNHQSPSSVLADDGLIDPEASSLILMNFANSSADTTDGSFNVSNFAGGVGSSGIYKVGTGQYIVILNGLVNLSGSINLWGQNSGVANAASSTTDYVDIWTVKTVQGSNLSTFVNEFFLRSGRFTTVTEPLMIRAHSSLVNNRINLGSKVDLKITNELNVENANIDEPTRNLFKDSLITSAAVEIVKLNEDRTLPSRVTVSSFAQTSAMISVTSDNTIVFTWDTAALATHAEMLAGRLGPQTGVYDIRVRFNLLNELIYSHPMALTVR